MGEIGPGVFEGFGCGFHGMAGFHEIGRNKGYGPADAEPALGTYIKL